MKYTKGSGPYTTEQESIEETLTEIDDVITIARIETGKGNKDLAITNLDEALENLKIVRRKVEIALQHVPEDVQQKNFL